MSPAKLEIKQIVHHFRRLFLCLMESSTRFIFAGTFDVPANWNGKDYALLEHVLSPPL